MSKKATAKTIPREILDLIRQEFNSSEFIAMSRGTGKWSFLPHLQKAISQFIEIQKATYPDLLIHYPKGPTEDLLRRAFNLKSPPGATKSLLRLELNQFGRKRHLFALGLSGGRQGQQQRQPQQAGNGEDRRPVAIDPGP